MNIESAQYISNDEGNNTLIKITIDGEEMFVPITSDNRHYAEIMRQVELGDLVIQEAE